MAILQYQYAPAAQAPQATPQYQYPAVPMPDQASQPTQPTQEVPTPAQPDPSTNPQAQQTQQYQYAPATQAPQATPMPITQQTASAGAPQLAANPTITALITPASVKTMGVSLGIGLAASLVFALLGSIIFLLLGHDIDSELSNIPNLSNSVDLFTSFGGSYSTPNFFQVLVTVLVLGVSGSLNVKNQCRRVLAGRSQQWSRCSSILPHWTSGRSTGYRRRVWRSYAGA